MGLWTFRPFWTLLGHASIECLLSICTGISCLRLFSDETSMQGAGTSRLQMAKFSFMVNSIELNATKQYLSAAKTAVLFLIFTSIYGKWFYTEQLCTNWSVYNMMYLRESKAINSDKVVSLLIVHTCYDSYFNVWRLCSENYIRANWSMYVVVLSRQFFGGGGIPYESKIPPKAQ